MDKVIHFLTQLKFFFDKLEGVVMDLLSAITPWLAPVVPAYITLDHCLTRLNFPWQVAWMTAASVEFLGLTSVYTAMQLISNGIKRGWLWRILVACTAWLFYVVIVVGVNSLLETGAPVVTFAKGALSLISVVAAIILAIRAQYKAWLVEKQESKQERRELRRQRPAPSMEPKAPRRLIKDDILAYLKDHPEDAAHPRKVAARLELNEGTVKVTINRLRAGGLISSNGHPEDAPQSD